MKSELDVNNFESLFELRWQTRVKLGQSHTSQLFCPLKVHYQKYQIYEDVERFLVQI